MFFPVSDFGFFGNFLGILKLFLEIFLRVYEDFLSCEPLGSVGEYDQLHEGLPPQTDNEELNRTGEDRTGRWPNDLAMTSLARRRETQRAQNGADIRSYRKQNKKKKKKLRMEISRSS